MVIWALRSIPLLFSVIYMIMYSNNGLKTSNIIADDLFLIVSPSIYIWKFFVLCHQNTSVTDQPKRSQYQYFPKGNLKNTLVMFEKLLFLVMHEHVSTRMCVFIHLNFYLLCMCDASLYWYSHCDWRGYCNIAKAHHSSFFFSSSHIFI